ncbi:MAG: hypothetical protein LBQ93_04435 [Treponema sp.]|nr:hypothetical protein [Treponema sp.]
MNKILPIVTLLLFSCLGLSCNNEMKYILFEGTEKLHGYVIFEKYKEENLYYFDLGHYIDESLYGGGPWQ